MKTLDKIVLGLLVVAGINWGLWGVFEFNLIHYIFGKVWINRLIYFLVGVAGVYVALSWRALTARWANPIKK